MSRLLGSRCVEDGPKWHLVYCADCLNWSWAVHQQWTVGDLRILPVLPIPSACNPQVLKRGGLEDENIIVMMADDIARHAFNPYPGKLFNKPGGPDVYQGVPKDYTGSEVNAANVLKVGTFGILWYLTLETCWEGVPEILFEFHFGQKISASAL